jgi:hypothetical protein
MLAEEAMSMTTPAVLIVLTRVQEEVYRYAYALGDAAVAAATVAAAGVVLWYALRAVRAVRPAVLTAMRRAA